MEGRRDDLDWMGERHPDTRAAMTVRDRLNVGFDPDTIAELHVIAKELDIRVPHAVRRLVAYGLLYMPHKWTPPPNGEQQ